MGAHGLRWLVFFCRQDEDDRARLNVLDAMTIADHVALPPAPHGWFNHAFAALMDGSLALVRTRIDVNAEWKRWWSAGELDRSGGPERRPLPDLWTERMRLSIFDGTNETDVVTVPPARFPVVDRLADGRWVVASTYAPRLQENAFVVGPDGNELARFHLGHAIEHLQCSPDGTIWVGYFDEGACGGGGEPASGGIVQFDEAGRVLWSFNGQDFDSMNLPEKRELGTVRPNVCDCYAMTLTGDVMWACTYADFPISRRSSVATNIWSNNVTGARALAADDDTVLLAGGYNDDGPRLAVVHVSDRTSRELGSLHFEPAARRELPLVQGRNGVLHVVCDEAWYRLPVRRAAEAVAAHPTLWEHRGDEESRALKP